MSTGRKPTKKRNEAAVEEPASRELSLVSQAYETLKERIITLSFLPGQYLNEASVCSLLGLGRTPIHQAFQRLHVEGLVEVMPRKGIVILPDSIPEVIKILESRLAVEPELARKAAQAASEGGACDDLRSMAVMAEPADGVPDIDAFMLNDRAFHARIGKLSGNEFMHEFARRLHERSTRFWYSHLWQTLDISRNNRQHLAIAEAIRSGDGDRAAEAMRDHIVDLRRILETLERSSTRRLARVEDDLTQSKSRRSR